MAIKLGDATKVVAIDNMSLVFVALLVFLFLGKGLKWQGILVIFNSGRSNSCFCFLEDI
ncbi:MAG: hypothetical protein PHG24_01230 [Candidatus Pacebacteria bacterium]|nr:hypothetical protein [Candidatus Paceibacterota bacterium]